MATAYSLLRYSSADADARPASLRPRAAEAYCARRSLHLDTELRARADRAEKLPAPRRTEIALTDFLDRVQSGDVTKGSYLLVESLGAMTRARITAVVDVLEHIVNRGITLVALPDGAECTRATLKSDPTALLFAVVGFVRAHNETALKSRRARVSWSERRERAHMKEHISAICPAWLTLDRETGAFRVSKERARVVDRIYQETLRGAGQAQIAESLNRDGVAVFGRGKMWHRSYVLKLLRSAAVLGTYTPHTTEVIGGRRVSKPAGAAIRNYFPRIVDPDVFMQVQTLVKESRSPLRGRHARTGSVANVFGGLARCGRCGASVTLVSKGKAPKSVRYLVCSAARVNAGCRTYEAIPYARFESALLRNRERLISKARAGERRADLDRLITEADAATYSLGDTLENLHDRVARGLRTASIISRIRKLESEREKLVQVADSLRAERETTTGAYVRDRVQELHKALSTDPFDRMTANAAMRQVFSSVTVDYDGADLAFLWRHGGQTEIDLS